MFNDSRSAVDIASYLAEKYSDMVYRCAFAFTANRHDAQDIMQEVFLRYLKKPAIFQSEDHEKAWLLRVTSNCSKSFLTSPWKKRTICLEEVTSSFDQTEPDETESSVTDVMEAVFSLPPKQRLCVHCFYYEELSIEQIAFVTGMKISTIKSHLFRARTTLRNMLKGEIADV